MKKAFLLSTVLLPFLIHAQLIHQFQQPVPPNSKLLQMGEQTIMIHPFDLTNSAHKWTTFDKDLQQVATKKLVTPDVQHIISQTYLESHNTILRIDQLFIEDHIYVTAYAFDTEGNLIKNQLLTSVLKETTEPVPLLILQSPDKKYAGIVQLLNVKQDSLFVNSLIVDADFEEINKAAFTVPFDPVVSEVHLPLLNNQAALTVPVADRFDSYKLSSNLNLHILPANAKIPSNIPIDFSRLKLRNHQFATKGDSIIVSALYSDGNKKKDIAGVVLAGITLSNKKQIPQQTFAYNSEAQAALKKQFLKEGRKGNLLNYLSPLPFNNKEHHFALLLSSQEMTIQARNNVPGAPPSIEGVRHDVGHVKGMEGTTLRGTDKPMTFDQASTYAATVGGAHRAGFPVSVYNRVNAEQMRRLQGANKNNNPKQSRNLLYFSFAENAIKNNFIKLKQPSDQQFSFLTYLPASNGYSAIYYLVSGNKTILQQTTIESDGKEINQKILDNSSIIILDGYDYLINNNSLTAFYEDKLTGQMGLVKVSL